MRTLIVALGVTLVCGAGLAFADGSCDFQGKDYLNGSDICRAGTRYRCENSEWHALGTPCALQSALAQAGCEYLGESYPSGRVECQSGIQQRCDGGAWQSLGTRCDDTTVATFSGFFARSVDDRTCAYGGAQFQEQSIMCRSGTTFLCEGGRWINQGAPCE